MATHSNILSWEIHAQRGLVGYSLWSCKELDMTEDALMHYIKHWFIRLDLSINRHQDGIRYVQNFLGIYLQK